MEAPSADQPDSFKTSDSDTTDATTSLPSATSPKKPIQLGVVQSSSGARPMQSNLNLSKKSRWDQAPGTGENEEEPKEINIESHHPEQSNIKNLIKKFEDISGSSSKEESIKSDESLTNKPGRVKLVRSNFSKSEIPAEKPSDDGKVIVEDNKLEEIYVKSDTKHLEEPVKCKALQIISSNYDSPSDESSQEADEISNDVSVVKDATPSDSAYASLERLPKDNGSVGEKTVEELTSSLSLQNLNVPTSDDCCEMEIKDSCELASETEGLNKDDKKVNIGDVDLNNSFTKIKESEISNVVSGDIAIEKTNSVISVTSEKNIETLTDTSQATKKTGDLIQDECHVSQEDIKSKDQDLVVLQSSGGNVVNDSTDNSEKISTMEINRVQTQLEAIELERSNDYENNSNVTDTDAKSENCNTITSIRDNNVEESQDNPTTSLDEKVSNKIRINSPEKLPQEIEPNNSSDDDFVLITHADVEGYNSVIESPSTDCVLTGESSKSIGDNSLAEKILSGPHVKDKSKDSSEINKIIHKAKEIESSDSKETHEIENEEDLESLMVEAQDNKVDDFSPVAEQYERKERNVDKEPICEESLCNEDVLEMFNDGVDAKMEQIFSENSGNVSEETCSSFKQNTEEDLLSSLTNELVEEKIVTNDPIVSEKSSKEEETENILETNDSLLKMLESGGSPETGAHLEDKEVNVITDNVDQSIIEGKEVTQVCEQNNSENEESVKKVGKSTKLTESNVPDSVNVEHEMLEITFSEIVQPVDKTDWPKENSGSIGGKEIIADVPDMESRVDKNKDSQQESDRTTIDQNIEEKIKDSNITIEGSEALFTSKESKFDFGDNLSLESKDDTRNEFQIKTGNNSTDGNLLAKEDGDKLERDGKGALNETNDSEIVIEEVETIESDVMNEDSAQILELEDEVATMERDSKVAQMDIEVSEISEGLVTEEMECAENAQETETTEFTFRSDTLDSGMQMSKVEEDIAIATESETIIENIELMEEKNVSCVVPIENSEATSSIEVPHHETIKQNLTSVEITNAVEDTSLSDKIKEMEEKSSNSNQLDSGQSSTSVISETESSQECNSKNIENSLNFQKEILKETEDTTNSETWSSPVESKLTPINKEGSIEVSQQETIERSIDMLFEIPSNEHPMNSSKSSTSSSSHDKKLEVTSEAKKLFSEEIQKEMLKLSPEHEAQCEEIISNSTESESNDKIMSDSCQLSKESTLNNDIKNDKPTSISDQGGETLPCDASDIATIQAIDSFLEGDNIKTSTSEENEQIKTIDENSKNVATTSSINEKTNAEDVMLGVEGDLDLDNSLSYDTKKLDLSPSSEPAISEETYDLPGESYDKESLDKEQENLHSGVLQNVESSTAQEGSGNSNLIETTPTTCLAETEKSSLNESHLLHETDLEANVKSTRVELPTCSSSLCSDKEQNYIVKLSDVRQSLEKAPLSDKNKFFGGLKHELELKMPRSEVISIEVDGKKLQSGETEKESDQPDLTSKPQVASCTDENIDFENLIPCTAVSSDENLISSPVKSSKEIDAVTDVTEEATGLNKQSESLISNQSKEIKNESNTELGTQRDELIPPVDVSSTKISTDESKNKQPSSSSIDLNTASNTNTEKLASVASKELAVPKSDKMDLIIEEKSKQDADLPNLAEGQTTTVEDSSKDSTEVKSTPLESTSNKIPCDIQKSFTNITPSKEKNTLPLATSSNRGCAATGSVESESSEEVTQSLRRFRFIPTKTDTSVREKPVSTTEPLNEVKITDTDTSELKLLREVDNKNSNVQEDKSAPPIDSGNEASPEVTPVTEQAAKPSKPTTVKDIPAPVRVSARQKQRQAAALAAKEKAEAEKSPGLGSAKKVNIQEKQGDKRGKKSLSPTKELHIKISGKSTESGKQSPLSSQKSPKNLESKINLQVSPKKIAKEVSQDKLEPITLKLSKEDNPVIVRSSSLSPKKNVSPHSPQGKTLGYTLKIGKDSTTIIPKDSTPSPTRRESSPGTGSPKTDLSGKVGYLIKDTGLTITPVAPVETQEQKLSKITLKLSKAGGHPEIKQENKSETWKAIRKLGEIDIVPVEGKSPTEGSKRKDRTDDGSPDKKLKLGDVTVEPSTSSGVSKLQGLLTQAPLNQSDSSEDGKFIGFGSPTEKLSPAQQQSSYDIGMIRHDDSPQPPRKRGRPRKITSPDDIVHSVTVPHSLPTGLTAKDILAASLQHQSLQQHLHQSYQQPQSFQQPQEDLDSSQPMVPLFDLFEDTFIDPSPPTIFPDQVQPSTEIIMRSARGRPIGRSRRPRGSGLLRAHERGGPRGRPRGSRGIKRILEEMEAMSFPDPDQPITLDNIDAEMGPRFSEQAASELTMALLRKSIEGKKEILEKKARKSDGSDEGNSDLDAKVREMKEKIEAAYQAELKSPGKEGKKRTPEKPESNKKSPPGLIPIHQKQDESTRRKSADGKESVKRKLSGDKSGEQPASKRKSTDENLEGSRSETGGTEENTEDSQMEVDQTTSPEEPTTQEEKAEPEPPPKPVKPRPRSKAEIKRIKREKDRLRREAKKLAALEALKAPPPNPCEEDTRMSASDLNGEDGEGGGIKKNRMEVGDPEGKEFTVEQIAEYQWPLQGGELYMIQEQISTWLGVKSFQRKYPDLKRRRVEMEERTYLCDSGLVSESMCDLGLTAVSSSEVLDIMFQDFPDQYEELRKHMREKQARELIQKQKERKKFEQTLSKSDLKEHAIQSLVSWNSNLNKSRNETRKCHLDLQTWTIQYPRSKVAKMTRPTPKLGSYPVALIPGQYSDYYKRYTPQELRYFPVNTVLYGPLQPNEMHSTGGSDGSQSESEDSSSSDGTSDSSSDGEGTEEEEKEKERTKECRTCGSKKSNEAMLQCSQCSHNIHVSCADLNPGMLVHVRKYQWQCSVCKTCQRCNNAKNESKMLFCDLCDRGYHSYCVGLRRVPAGSWTCELCTKGSGLGSQGPQSETPIRALWANVFTARKRLT